MSTERVKVDMTRGGDERQADRMKERLVENGAPSGRAEELVRDAVERNKAGKD